MILSQFALFRIKVFNVAFPRDEPKRHRAVETCLRILNSVVPFVSDSKSNVIYTHMPKVYILLEQFSAQ